MQHAHLAEVSWRSYIRAALAIAKKDWLHFFRYPLNALFRVIEPLGIQVTHRHNPRQVILQDSGHIHLVCDSPAPDLPYMNFFARRVLAQDG